MHPWNCLFVSIHPADLDQASGILWSLGTIGIEELYAKAGKRRIRAFFSPLDNIRQLRKQFAEDCRQSGIPCFGLSHRQVKDIDWLKGWHKKLKPFPVGSRFYIVPDPLPNPSIPRGRLPIFLEPGMAFGTGTHETTQLCLESLEQELIPGSCCLDVGTGSGILAIAAVKLGARNVVACDPDPLAIKIARLNATKNRCRHRVRWLTGEVSTVGDVQYDFLVANLTFEIIQHELSQFELRLKEGGTMILSGLLTRQADKIRKSRPAGLIFKARRDKGEWSCLDYRKKTG